MKNIKTNKNLLLYIIFFSAIIGFCFCSFSCSKQANQQKAHKYSIVATNFVCYDFARAALGDSLNKTVSLKLLIKPGTEVHSFDPTPADIIAIGSADLFIYIGGESDEWVESVLLDSIGKNKNAPACLKLIDFVQTLDEPEALESEENERTAQNTAANSGKTENDNETEAESDEHIWTSPENALIMLEKITGSILQNCPDLDRDSVLKNSADYARQIEQAAAAIGQSVAAAEQKYIVMADRFPFAYFANYYGLNYMAAFAGCSTAVEASSATIASLIETVKQKQLPAVFYIELTNHKIADIVAESAKVPAYMLYSLQNISKDDFEAGETYVSLMNKNAETLKKGLR
ncbi:MAG: metal ABC transporter substrate-binding protein [Treponemataceae bacterium]|nr:metal ABC transporter substrate-binding protein [Treponemataceae bacterium]